MRGDTGGYLNPRWVEWLTDDVEEHEPVGGGAGRCEIEGCPLHPVRDGA